MQDTTNSLPAAFESDPAVTTWWAPSLPAGAHPAIDAAPPPPAPPPPDADVGIIVTLMVLGIVFTPFAWACWAYSNGQLKLIETGERSTASRSAIVVARGVAAFVTVLSLTLITMIVARSCGA